VAKAGAMILVASLAAALIAFAAAPPAASFTPRTHSLTVADLNDGAQAFNSTFGSGNWSALDPYVDMVLLNRSQHVPQRMKTMLYLDVGMCSGSTGPGRNEYPFPDCADWPADAFYAQPGHPERLLTGQYAGHILQRPGNPASSAMRALTLAAIERALGNGDDDLIEFDDSAPPEEWYGRLCWGAPIPGPGADDCVGAPGGKAHGPYGDGPAAWVRGMRRLIAALPRPAVISGLAGYSGNGPSATAALVAESPNAWGAICDSCFFGGSAIPSNKFMWSGPVFRARLDGALRVTGAGKNVIVINSVVLDTQARARALADIMLFYAADRTWFWQAPCGRRSHIRVCPEAALTFYQPVAPYPSRSRDLEVKGGALVREFAACYAAGRPLGPCASVVNADPYSDQPLPRLQHEYAHTLRITGDSLCVCYGDSGSVSAEGPAPPERLPAASGYVLFR
jgi:hypothetical protein